MSKTVKDKIVKTNKKSIKTLKRLLPQISLEFIQQLMYIVVNYNINDSSIRDKVDSLYVDLVSIVFKYKRIRTKDINMVIPNTLYGIKIYSPRRKYIANLNYSEVTSRYNSIVGTLSDNDFMGPKFEPRLYRITKYKGEYYYRGFLINLKKSNKGYKYFDILYKMAPLGGKVKYEDFKRSIKFKSKSGIDFNVTKEIQNNLTHIDTGILEKIRLIKDKEGIDDDVVILKSNKLGYIEFCNKI